LAACGDYLLIENAVAAKSVAVFPDTLPFDVAALNEPMAVARHCVNRSEAKPTDKVVVFGAGPIGLGATIWLKLRGVEHVAVADVIPERLETALAIGADAVSNSASDDVPSRLTELHGPAANALGRPRPGTDIYIDAAGAPTEIFEVTPEIAEHQDRFAKLISHRIPFSDVERAYDLALTPGAAEKVIVTLDDQT
jgi:threonine dehydrogenase-like Zn-dependent dehydrogenase